MKDWSRKTGILIYILVTTYALAATDHLIGMEFRMGILDVDDTNHVTLDMIIKA